MESVAKIDAKGLEVEEATDDGSGVQRLENMSSIRN